MDSLLLNLCIPSLGRALIPSLEIRMLMKCLRKITFSSVAEHIFNLPVSRIKATDWLTGVFSNVFPKKCDYFFKTLEEESLNGTA